MTRPWEKLFKIKGKDKVKEIIFLKNIATAQTEITMEAKCETVAAPCLPQKEEAEPSR